MNSSRAIITTRDLSLGFKDRIIVSHISLDINKGEFIGIFGANGSGKTTFLKALLGLVQPAEGHILIFGQKPQHGNKNVGYMPQLRSNDYVKNLTCETIIASSLNSTKLGLPLISRQQKKDIREVLRWVEASDYADRPFSQLSGGERQRVYLAQALLSRPSVLLLDEPLSGLDLRYQETFISVLCTIQKKLNSTILFTAHDPNPLLGIMDRVLYFANKKAALGTIDTVITSEKLTALYETPIEVVHYKNRLIVLGENLAEGHHD